MGQQGLRPKPKPPVRVVYTLKDAAGNNIVTADSKQLTVKY